MTESSADQRLFLLNRLVNALVVIALLVSGVVSFQFIASPQAEKGGAVFVGMTVLLVVSGVAAILTGTRAMTRSGGASIERARSWYAIAFGLVALAMGATFGVGFV